MKDNSVVQALRKVINTIVVILFIVVVVVVSAQVFSRFVIHLSIRWADEVSRYAFVWLVYIGGAITIREGRNVAFDLILDSRKGKQWKAMFTLVNVISIVYLILLTYFGVRVCIAESVEFSPIMRFPMWVVSLAIPLGGVLMTIEQLLYFIEHRNDKDTEAEAVGKGGNA